MAYSKYGYDTSCFNLGLADQTVSIRQLSSDLVRPVVIGIIIGKQDPRGIQNKKQPGTERFVLNFTLRDSPVDTLNAFCWGEETVIRKISSSFMIGNVVKVKNAQVVSKQDDGSDDRFRPPTNSVYQLNISPLYSEIIICDDQYMHLFGLLHYSMHSSSDFVPLAEIIFNGKNMEGMCVNLLVAIKDIGTLQDVRAKDGRTLKKFQLTVFDQSHPVFPVLIWDEETANFILKCCQKSSILLISDVRVSYNDFMKGMIATATSCTVFTPDPETREAKELAAFAKAAQVSDGPFGDNSNFNSMIYNVQEVEKLRNSSELSAFEDTEGILYACFSSFDLDGYSRLTSLKCSKCKHVIRAPETQCSNGSCDVGCRLLTSQPEEYFDVPITLTDHTGTLLKCAFSGSPVETLLGMKLERFQKLTEHEKTDLKWLFLWERFKFRFKIPQISVATGNRTIIITSCDKMTPDDIKTFMASSMSYL